MPLHRKEHFKQPLADLGLLFGRITIGLSMAILHGWPKLTGFAERADSFPDPLGIGSPLSLTAAIGAELFGSLLLVIGLLTRAALIPLIITTLVIVFLVQGDNPFRDHASRELALIYGFAYVTFLFTGPGRFSLDKILKSWSKKRSQ